ncbi:ABC transporter G family member 34 [Citrus sinensis]|uniref:ABC transporter G family member 34 n=1 Tax=Citrus sinensis TaxID=2711 RepID=A0ACB8K018_CITSI|nr:ABC transporter G family member 34 [Citrus sinensis]
MALPITGGDDIVRSLSMGSSAGNRSGRASSSFREVWKSSSNAFSRSQRDDDEEEELRWAAIERLPTYDRLRRGMLSQLGDDGKVVRREVNVKKLGMQDRKQLRESILKLVEEDNDKFLRKLRERIDRVGIDIPKIEIRYEHLNIQGEVHIGSRAIPTLPNAVVNIAENVLGSLRILPSKKRKIQILKDVSGLVKPSRMTLLLGPPGAGKTTLLMALAGKLDDDLKLTGKIKYCGHEFKEFVPQRTCAYISQNDLHFGEMTVRETMDFSGRCLGVGTRYEMLAEISRREKEAGIKPDPEIDAYMKATALAGQKTSLATDYVLKLLGLDICADTMVGDQMRRGVSGGQKKRVTTGEMLVGPAKVLLMDEISTGLDSSTTFQICKYMKQMVHVLEITTIVSLLQPAPEAYDLFDNIILLSEGQIVYQGPREKVLEFFEYMGFKCPDRKGVADFLQEVTSKKDQEQYWFRKDQPYRYISVSDFVQGFSSFHVGQQLANDLAVPYDKSRTHPAALVKNKYGISNMDLFRACFGREWLLMKRNSFVYIFKTSQITIMSLIALTVFFRTEMPVGNVADGAKFYGALFFSLINLMFNGLAELAFTVFRLPVFFKQRDHLFYPPWAYALPIFVLRIPLSILESAIWVCLTYYTIGFAPAASRFFRQYLAFFAVNSMALSLFRFIGSIGRTEVVANTLGTFTLLLVFVLGGFVIAKDDIEPFMIWGYYVSPMMYGQNAIVINEFLDERWSKPVSDPNIHEPTVGKLLLKSRGFFTVNYWYWICIGALIGFTILFNILFIAAIQFLNPLGKAKPTVIEEDGDKKKKASGQPGTEGLSLSIVLFSLSCAGNRVIPIDILFFQMPELSEKIADTDMSVRSSSENVGTTGHAPKKGMVLPFQPLSLAFHHVNYSVDMPAQILRFGFGYQEMKAQGIEEDRLQLLRDVSGVFRPGVLTALMGVSGAGKTTLMDVLAGRKTGGYTEGDISISGYPKNQATFARVSGYCEQNDIHSPHVTVYESLLFSAWLRLSSDIDSKTRKMFVDEVMDLVELEPLTNAMVGLPGVDGLSTEQRKRLTIAVELVANPSIIFMDEPTSGLDARAAAIVMRTVRNTVDTGRTVVCTIHQPSIDIFEAFDEAVPGVPRITNGYNPATWMLEISTPTAEAQLNVDFADIYVRSSLYQRNEELIKELSTPAPGSSDLYFPTQYSQPFLIQCKACFWKQRQSYWRDPQYNALRFAVTIVVGLLFGLIFWDKGQKTKKQQDLQNLFGALYCAVFFLGSTNANSVMSVVSTERTVFYRERAAGMYSTLAYAFSQASGAYRVDICGISNCRVCSDPILHDGICVESKKILLVLVHAPQIGAILSGFFLSLWNLFSGFLIPRVQIPIWWRWYYWLSPVAWTLYGLVTSQVGDIEGNVEIPGSTATMTVKQLLKDSFGFKYDFLPVVAVVKLVWLLVFVFVFTLAITLINFQRR